MARVRTTSTREDQQLSFTTHASLPHRTELPPEAERQAALHQYFTPLWVADALLCQFFPTLSEQDLVFEPFAGNGAVLLALNGRTCTRTGKSGTHIPAIGCEIDPRMAAIAKERTGREIIVGDIRDVALDFTPTAVVSNAPFKNDLIEAALDRIHRILVKDGRVGLILSALTFGSSERVVRFNEKWSLEQYALPRYIYPRLQEALCFGIFTKDQQRRMVGFALHHELEQVKHIHQEFKRLLQDGKRPPWPAVVRRALEVLGGRATVDQVCNLVIPHAPPGNSCLRDKMRQCLQQHRWVSRGCWELDEAS